MADGDALHVTRTKAFSAVGVRKHWKADGLSLLSSVSTKHRAGCRPASFRRKLKKGRLKPSFQRAP
jgi:hypothetical protein